MPVLDPNDPLASLPPTAQRILDAAWRIVIDEGFAALSFGRIAKLSGENRGSITYHFGNKEGLVLALIDAYVHDANLEVVKRTTDLPKDAHRLGIVFDTQGRIATGREYVIGFAELFPSTLRNPAMLKEMATLYDGYRANIARALGAATPDERAELAPLAHLVLGMVDGLSIQHTINPDDPAIDAAIALMNRLVRDYLHQQGKFDAPPADD